MLCRLYLLFRQGIIVCLDYSSSSEFVIIFPSVKLSHKTSKTNTKLQIQCPPATADNTYATNVIVFHCIWSHGQFSHSGVPSARPRSSWGLVPPMVNESGPFLHRRGCYIVLAAATRRNNCNLLAYTTSTKERQSRAYVNGKAI